MTVYRFRVAYRIGEGKTGYEVTRLIETENGEDIDALQKELSKKWAGQPIHRIERVDPPEKV
jgi:hypothetical protein